MAGIIPAFQTATTVLVFVFVVTNMVAVGLSLTAGQIARPLRSYGFIARLLLANFVVVPLLAYALRSSIPMPARYGVGLIIIGCAAGGPFLPKLVQIAKADLGLGVAVMALLMLCTVFYLPLVGPLLISSIHVTPLDLLRPLLIAVLLPLSIGLLVRRQEPAWAAQVEPYAAKVANGCLLAGIVTAAVGYTPLFWAALHNGAALAAICLIVGAAVTGWLLGGRDFGVATVSALGTAQRNMSATLAIVLSLGNSDALVMTVVTGILALGLLTVLARVLSRSSFAGRRWHAAAR